MKTQRFFQGHIAPSAVLVFVALSATGMSAQPQYSFKDLGTLSGLSSTAVGINDAGQVTGDSGMPDGARHAFVYWGGQMNDLGTLGGSSSHAYAINNLGQVVGYSDVLDGSGSFHAFRCSGAMMDASSDLGTLGGRSSAAYAVNDFGLVVGYSDTGYHDASGNVLRHAFLYPDPNEPGKMQDLATLGGFSSWATAINNPGDVVGYSDIHVLGAVFYHAFRYSRGQLRDLGTLGGNSSWAVAINDLGFIVGRSEYTPGNVSTHAFLHWNPDDPTARMRDLGTLGGSSSWAVAINLPCQVAGTSQTPGNVATHAFLYPDPNDPTKMKDLGTLGGTSSWATAINNDGTVVGYSDMPGNLTRHAFLYPGPDGNMLDLGPLGGSSSAAVAINGNGKVALNVTTGGGTVEHAFLHPGGNGQLQDLGTLRGLHSYGRAINDSGDVVGQSSMPINTLGYIVSRHAFLYSAADGKMKDLGTFGKRWNDGWSEARAVNNGQQVVGASFSNSAGTPWHAFRYPRGDLMRDLGTLPGFWSSYANAINTYGRVVGYCLTGDEHRSRAFIWPNSADGMSELPTLGGSYCEATDINNGYPAFRVVGRSTRAGDHVWRSFIFTETAGIQEIGASRFSVTTNCEATAINDAGWVVGCENSSGPYHAFLAKGTSTYPYTVEFTDLMTLGGSSSYAHDINKAGQVVGSSDMPGNSVQHAFLYYNGVIRDLNDLVHAPGWTLWEARGINSLENVQITGTALSPDGYNHAFVLTRISGSGLPAPAIVDTTSPTINSLTVAPNVVGVPAGQMVPMTVTALVSDAIDPFPQSSILGVVSNQPISAGVDYIITGPLTISLKCTSASSGTRVYTINVESVDGSGNAAVGSVSTVAAPLPPRPRGR